MFVGYLAAEAVSASAGFDGVRWTAAVVAVGLAMVPFGLSGLAREADRRAAGRVAALAVSLGAWLVAVAGQPGKSLLLEVVAAAALPVAGWAVASLACTVPDRPRAIARVWVLEPTVVVLAWLTAGMGVVAVVPVFWLGELGPWIAPGRWAQAPLLFWGGALIGSAALRFGRRRLGSSPAALAGNLWPILGLLGALALWGVGLVSGWVDGGLASRLWLLLVTATALLLVAGHAALIDERRSIQAHHTTRSVIAGAIVVVAATGAATLGLRLVALTEERWVLFVAALVTTSLLAVRRVRRGLDRVLVPAGGRLLRAAHVAEQECSQKSSLEELAEMVLGALRRAGKSDSSPLLYVADPPATVSLDAAGQPQVRPEGIPKPLFDWFLAHPRSAAVRALLEREAVRKPDLRPLVRLLVDVDVLCAVPITSAGELEGVLMVPRGRRRAAVVLEELTALQQLARSMSGVLSLVCAQRRARQRAGNASRQLHHLREELDLAKQRLDEALQALEVQRGQTLEEFFPLVAYSPAMRGVLDTLPSIAESDAPVLLVGEDLRETRRIAELLHRQSPRRSGPCVFVDLSTLSVEQIAPALFGSDTQPGLIGTAQGGTFILAHIAALGAECQDRLSEVISSRRVLSSNGVGASDLDLQWVVYSSVPLDALGEGLLRPRLAQWLGRQQLRVPALAERTEDLSSLVLAGIDRACRARGLEPKGMDSEAFGRLVKHAWPGGTAELQQVIELAVLRASGRRITTAHLPSLGLAVEAARSGEEPLGRTHAEVEALLLRRAMERAGGNKSEAARMIGLKRSTFVDKLRRHGLVLEPMPPRVRH